ncbi:MAG: ADP-heptose:LPS heptosyltransferase-like protein [Pedosphaera sp.]|nr:ADP-heptose:LPS heptosyltransferase-like protein [Pedosphaera sp.]
MRSLLLRCGLSPGDIVMLTAAVRDLHHWYPGQFVTGVRTSCMEIWEHNPLIVSLPENDPTVEPIDCAYPLIDRCNQAPYHCLHGFIEFLNERLGLAIKPTAFHGDIHLSGQEKAWYSQVHEFTGEDTPFWIVAAGGKYDVTIKWWESERYQEVVNHFRGKIQFVQVGELGHHHPKLDGVIDLRGRTSLRELVRLVHHSQGVLCSVTALMHLAAAIQTRPGRNAKRPCVVVAGGREPAHWEAYPDHQFVHTNGALACCANGGCWKDRTARLQDGDERDHRDHLCVDVSHGLPRCMDLITSAEVIRRIELYFQGGVLNYLSRRQRTAAERGVVATAGNSFDQQPLNLHNAGMACEQFIRTMPASPNCYEGRGIVICGGGIRYFTNAWVCINRLRRSGCRLPVQVWHLGGEEMDQQRQALLAPLGVECVDASVVRKQFPARILQGWELKPYAMLHSSFREVLLLDADNVPVVDPEFLFDTPQFQETGAVFWPDYDHGRSKAGTAIWRSCGLGQPPEPEFETGQILIDKQHCWSALRLCLWFNENSDFYYQHLHGDKETFHLAFRKMKQAYSLVPTPIHSLEGTMCQHDFEGRRILQHRNGDKWDLFLHNHRVKDFWFEQECRGYVTRLQRVWDGGMGLAGNRRVKTAGNSRKRGKALKIGAAMIWSAKQDALRLNTLANFAKTDWDGPPLQIRIEDGEAAGLRQRRAQGAFLALKRSLECQDDFTLLLEDQLDFNRHLRHNLHHWRLMKTGAVTFASLYNPRVRERACDLRNNARIVEPEFAFGNQAFLIARSAVEYLVRHWDKAPGGPDTRITHLAGRLRSPIFYHAPSLVQHIGPASEAGRSFHQAMDFDPAWRA